jgi:Probable Zinc-ribbon domain
VECRTCHREWKAVVASRMPSPSRLASGCPACWEGSRSVRRSSPKAGRSLMDTHPRITREFRENLSDPMRSPADLRPGSNNRCRWECDRGHQWVTTVNSRTFGSGTACRQCVAAGISRFEPEVAAMLRAACGVAVETDHPVVASRRGSDRPWRVDLYLPDLDQAVDLTPRGP